MKPQLDMNKIAKGLGAQRRGKAAASGGYFRAMQLLADVEARFRVPSGDGSAQLRDTVAAEFKIAPACAFRFSRDSTRAHSTSPHIRPT
jgi:hypothetical protein